jgi:hypothetical protein
MSESPDKLPNPPEWMKDFLPIGQIELSNRQAAGLVFPDLDYESQLYAIHTLLERNRAAEKATVDAIKEIKESVNPTETHSERAELEWLDRVHQSVYDDAAHSMAAVGMLAPFCESLFYQAFQGIRKQVRSNKDLCETHDRWQRPTDEAWDCHFVWNSRKRRKDLLKGIAQLADATQLTAHLPKNYEDNLTPLFAYRNKMFHGGFEWRMEERTKFERRIKECRWESKQWFSFARSGGAPWIIYLTNKYVDLCMTTIDEVIEGIGAYCNKHFFHRGKGTENSNESV